MGREIHLLLHFSAEVVKNFAILGPGETDPRQLLGIGIDEGTAAVVTGRLLEVIGTHRVHILDARRRETSDSDDDPVTTILRRGERFDLVAGERSR